MTMKITKSKLKQIIKEELQKEGFDDLNMFKRILGFESKDGKRAIYDILNMNSSLRAIIEDYYDSGTFSWREWERVRPRGGGEYTPGGTPENIYVPRNIRAAVANLPDGAQRAKGKKALSEYHKLLDQAKIAHRQAAETLDKDEALAAKKKEWQRAEEDAAYAEYAKKAKDELEKQGPDCEENPFDPECSKGIQTRDAFSESKKLTKHTLKRVIREEIKKFAKSRRTSK